MKSVRWAALFSLSLLLGTGCAASLVGKAAPDFQLPNYKNQPVRLSDYQGKSVVLTFYYADS
ncbi:MAG: redoxin domain-containing protein [Deltaproteobacteria bacterium]|nr:redoxin domain-containing protein [Deltaproteobacteria bacterium]